MKTGHQLRTVLLVAMIARLGLFALVHAWTLPVDQQLARNNDSALYHRLGMSLEEDGEFKDNSNDRYNALRTPGYPLFIAGIYSLFGPAPWLAIFFQLLLDTAACGLLFVALAKIIGEKAAFLAAIFYAVDPIVLLYDSFLLSEALCSFFLIAALYFGLHATSKENFKSKLVGMALCAFCFGLATWIRPGVQFIPLFLILYLFFIYRKQWITAVALSAVTILVFVATISPWLIRNHNLFDTYSLSTSGAYNLLSQNVAAAEAGRRGVDFKSESKRLLSEADVIMIARGGNPESNPFKYAAYQTEVARRYIKNNPSGFTWYHLKGTAYMFVNLGTSDYLRLLGFEQPQHARNKKDPVAWPFAIVIGLFFLASYACLIAGFKVAWKLPNRIAFYFLLFVAAYFILTPGAFALARFKIPVMIFLYAFAGLGFVYLSDLFYDRRLQRAQSSVKNS